MPSAKTSLRSATRNIKPSSDPTPEVVEVAKKTPRPKRTTRRPAKKTATSSSAKNTAPKKGRARPPKTSSVPASSPPTPRKKRNTSKAKSTSPPKKAKIAKQEKGHEGAKKTTKTNTRTPRTSAKKPPTNRKQQNEKKATKHKAPKTSSSKSASDLGIIGIEHYIKHGNTWGNPDGEHDMVVGEYCRPDKIVIGFKDKTLSGDGFVGQPIRVLKERLQEPEYINLYRKKRGILCVADLIDSERKNIFQKKKTSNKFKLTCIVVQIPPKYLKGKQKNTMMSDAVLAATRMIAALINQINRECNFKGRFQSCGMDSTDYNDIKYIGERIDTESTIMIACHELPNVTQDHMASDDKILNHYWGETESATQQAISKLTGEPSPHEQSDEDSYEFSDDSKSWLEPNIRGKRRKSTDNEDTDNDSFVASDDNDEDSNASFEPDTDAEETESRAKISCDTSDGDNSHSVAEQEEDEWDTEDEDE